MKICSNCGRENENDALYCVKCGNEFKVIPKAGIPKTGVPFIDDFEVTPTLKKAAIAIALNFFLFWGLGYWRLGIKKIYGFSWYMLVIPQIIIGILSAFVPFLGAIYFTANLALAYDIYEKANGRPGFIPVSKIIPVSRDNY
jgi:zinc-ribbon domain